MLSIKLPEFRLALKPMFEDIRSTNMDAKLSVLDLNYCFVGLDFEQAKLLNCAVTKFDLNQKIIEFVIDRDQEVLKAISHFADMGSYHNPIPLIIYFPDGEKGTCHLLCLDNFFLKEEIVAMTPITDSSTDVVRLAFAFDYDRARMEFIVPDES